MQLERLGGGPGSPGGGGRGGGGPRRLCATGGSSDGGGSGKGGGLWAKYTEMLETSPVSGDCLCRAPWMLRAPSVAVLYSLCTIHLNRVAVLLICLVSYGTCHGRAMEPLPLGSCFVWQQRG